jgi:1-acyl-sn-glycerol-3-phosphate acyltransferase
MLGYLRSALFSITMISTTVIYATLLVILFFLPFAARYALVGSYVMINLTALRVFCGIRYRVEGRENLPQGPAIIFSKHQSTFETLALQRIFPPICFVLKQELLWVPFFGWGLALLKPIAIKRGTGRVAIKQVISKGTGRLKEGLWVVIFPEGTRTRAGTAGRYHIGGAILAAESGYPIVPVAHNAGELWPRRQFLKAPGTVTVRIGPVIDATGKKAEQVLAESKNWIETNMLEISSIPYNYQPDRE